LAVPTDGEGHISRFASKAQLFNVAAGAAAILNHSTAFGIWIASFDPHQPNAGDACDEISEEAVAFSFGFDGRHGSKLHAFGKNLQPTANTIVPNLHLWRGRQEPDRAGAVSLSLFSFL
jgi:hypothetical protein